jgi:type IV pilus biogenesis protein PilP
LVAALAANCAYGQPAQSPSKSGTAGASETSGTPPAENTHLQIDADKEPVAIAHPPSPPQLAPLSPDFQTAMANSQLQTYRYNQLTEQALALKKLCDTGFGPVDICPNANAAHADGSLTTSSSALPLVAEISGSHGVLSAVLILADGRRVSVRAGSVLPDGLHIAAVTNDDVRVNNGSGRQLALPFADSGLGK